MKTDKDERWPEKLNSLNITAKGTLHGRIHLNNERLHSEHYSEKNFIQNNDYSWPGDFEGRTLLALTCLSRLLHAGCPESYLAIAEKNVNADKYFGKLFDGKTANEQQISGNSWYLRALAAVYREFGNAFAYDSIHSIVDKFVVRLAPFYEKYPVDEDSRDPSKKGEAIGALYTNAVDGWLLSTDTGCAFIALDGFTSAYDIYPSQALKELIERMIDKFMSIDKVGAHCQTHATLSAARGIMRYYEKTKEPGYLEYVKELFGLYTDYGMTRNYANYNWFLRQSWTEPCAIVDSLILAFSLYEATGEYMYAQAANRIYYNALRFSQRGNGGFGCDSCLDEEDNYLRPNDKFYEAYWCCTMRGAEGLLCCAENMAKLSDRAVTVLLPEPFDARSESGDVAFSLDTVLGKHCELKFKIDAWDGARELRVYLPEGYEKLKVSGCRDFTVKNNFLILKNPSRGEIRAEFCLRPRRRELKEGKSLYSAGDFLLGEFVRHDVSDNEVFLTERGPLTLVENMMLHSRAEGLSIRQRLIF